MARVEFNGEPGTVWTNQTEKVQYQLIVNWHNSCGLCIQYDHAIGPLWPTPFHHGCRCRQRIIFPGKSAEPFVDFRAKIDQLDKTQRARVIGVASLRLVESGTVQWADVVGKNRIRTLQEVVAREKLSVEQMVKAGVQRKTAEKAHASVNTPEHEIRRQKRAEAIRQLQNLGVGKEQIKQAFGKEVAKRVTIDAGPSGGGGVLRGLVQQIAAGAKDLLKNAILFVLGGRVRR